MMPSTRLALAALLALAACGEKADDATSATAADATAEATPHEAEFAGDVDAAIRDAAADTQAAAREAGVAPIPATAAAAEIVTEEERP